MARPLLGGFLKGGVCATLAWAIAWPLEVAKNKVQGAEGSLYKGRSTLAIVRQVAATDRRLYRGILPGALRLRRQRRGHGGVSIHAEAISGRQEQKDGTTTRERSASPPRTAARTARASAGVPAHTALPA